MNYPSKLIPYVDGWFGSEPESTVIPRTKYPFIENPTPDIYTQKHERDYNVVPRLYSPKIGIRTSWLNLLTYSEDLANAAWTKTNAGATTSTTAPDGRGFWQKLLETTANAEHSVAHAGTLPGPSSASELMVFAMAGLGREWIKLGFTDAGATVFSAFFNVATGQIGPVAAGTTAAIFPMGGGIYRCVIRFTPASSGAGTVKINVATGASTISYTGDAAKGMYLWGAQLVTGSGAPYVSTTTATRTMIAPNLDADDPFAFLVSESDPGNVNSENAIINRIFSRVPLTQVVPSSIRITKPSFSGSLPQQIGNYLVNQPDTSQQAFDAYLRQVLSADSGSAAGSGGALTGGTYTISFAGSTTAALAYNATAGAVQTALNAIDTVYLRGGVTVTGDYLSGFNITFAAIAAWTADGSGLTVATGGPVTFIVHAVPTGSGFAQSVGAGVETLPPWSPITGGTFTVTVAGQTTGGIAYNASVGTVQSALNALSNVSGRGGVTLLASPDPVKYSSSQIGFTAVYTYPLFTLNLGSTLPASSTATVTRLDTHTYAPTGFGRQQSIVFSGATVGTRTITTPIAHGITTADNIYVKIGAVWFFIAAGNFTVPTTTTIGLSAAAANAAISTDQATEVGKRVRANYEPGTVTVRCVRTSFFYLPGVTVGIATADDIVPPTYQGDANTMLQLIFGATGTINYDVGDLSPYQGPILSLNVVTIKASDL